MVPEHRLYAVRLLLARNPGFPDGSASRGYDLHLPLTAASYAQVQGANERIGVGFLGYGLIGRRHVLDFRQQPDVHLVGLAEAHSGRLEEGLGLLGRQPKGYGDFRELLDNRDVHARVFSTPGR